MSDPLQHYSVQQIAELIDLHPDSVRELINRGLLAACNVSLGSKARWRIAATDLAEFLAARRNVPLPERLPPLPEPSPAPPRRRKRADGHKRKYFLLDESEKIANANPRPKATAVREHNEVQLIHDG